MTDEQIVKCLEYCIRDDCDYCKECHYRGKGCNFALIKASYRLIKRQQAEIDRLTEIISCSEIPNK